MPGSRATLPVDEGLPDAAVLIDPQSPVLRGRLAELAARSTGVSIDDVDRVRLRYLEYAPGRRMVVQYQVTIGLLTLDAAAVATPESDPRLFGYPEDPALPMLSRPAEVADRFGIECIEPTRLAWVPMRRAALRFGDVVVKFYGDTPDADVANQRLRDVQGLIQTAAYRGGDGASRLVAQGVVPGRTLERGDAARSARAAVELLAALRRAPIPDLPVVTASDLIDQAKAPIDLVSFALPAVAQRLRDVRERLMAVAPETGDAQPAHGDFNVGQLIANHGLLTVIDVDTLCRAPAAFDVAAYATNVVSGRDDDWATLQGVLAAVTEASDSEPLDDLPWFVAATMLRRVDRAVRRLKRDWPGRTRQLVEVVESLTDALTGR